MRTSSTRAIFLGLFMALTALAMPHVLEWQAANMLRPYGAEHKVGIIVAAQIAPLQPGFDAQALLALVVIAAGAMAARLRGRALDILLTTFALLLANSLWSLRTGPDFSKFFALVSIVWLLLELWRTWKTQQLMRPT